MNSIEKFKILSLNHTVILDCQGKLSTGGEAISPFKLTQISSVILSDAVHT